MGFKLFVDDTRPFPKGFECVRSYDDCISYYRLFGEFDFVSLDYSLSEEHTAGYTHMDEGKRQKAETYQHSQQPYRGNATDERFRRAELSRCGGDYEYAL